MLGHRAGVYALATLLLGLSAVALAADDPRAWLERMERSLATRNYRGTFVHEHDGQSDTLRVVHRVSMGDVSERIQSMDGSGREFILHNDQSSTYFPQQHLVLVETAPQQGVLLGELLRLDSSAADLYRLSEESPTRVSGRVAQVIAVEPQDDLRYGYRVWIDMASAMPLKTQLLTAAGGVIEQMVFTELSLPTHIADSELQPETDARAFRWLRHDALTLPVGEVPTLSWQADLLPPGFRLTANTLQVLPGTSAAVTHLVFSDGLASVSVFVEAQRAAGAAGREAATGELGAHGVGARGVGGHSSGGSAIGGSAIGGSAASGGAASGNASLSLVQSTLINVGASSALSTTVDGHKVTVIGEVPAGTVRAIGRSLRSSAGGRR